MARALLVALTWAAAASAARYMDYSGVKMPQYGAGEYEASREAGPVAALEDYHGHSPDASSALDYKYEEETHGKSEKPLKEPVDAESWQKPSRKQRELLRPPEDGTLDKYDSEAENMSEYKSSRSFPKHRSRLKSRRSRKDDELSHKRSMRYEPDRRAVSNIDSRDYFKVDRDEFPDDKSKQFEDDSHFTHIETTERVIRRKPRDRFIKSRSDDDAYLEDGEVGANRRTNGARRMEQDYPMGDDERRGRLSEGRGLRYRPTVDSDDASPRAPASLNPKAYDDYGDYYDMKRVHNIKSKLPMLLRRSSAITTLPAGPSSNVVDELWTIRRAITSATADPLAVITPPPPTTDAVTSSTRTLGPTGSSVNNSQELSLAEKSKLSILKKAQRKEALRNEASTKKPPVLLQVTNKMPVVVMVEPASDKPWMRAREVSHDTPERLERAKRLMRHKLVARAKNIEDLTDNWDEVVCDYIDVALLDGAAALHRGAVLPVTTVLLFVLR